MSLIVVRHGQTAMNEAPGQPERLRGWMPVGLTVQGMQQMHQTAESLSDLAGQIKTIHASDLPRTVQSAHEISRVLGVPVTAMSELRDLNTGDFQNQEVSPQLLDQVHNYYRNPDAQIPGGESVNQWAGRVLPVVKPLVESPDLHVLVTHGRTAAMIHGMSQTGGQYPDLDTMMQKPPIDPAGVMILGQDWQPVYATPKEQAQKNAS